MRVKYPLSVLKKQSIRTYLAFAKCIGEVLQAKKSVSSKMVAATLLFEDKIEPISSEAGKFSFVTSKVGPFTICGTQLWALQKSKKKEILK